LKHHNRVTKRLKLNTNILSEHFALKAASESHTYWKPLFAGGPIIVDSCEPVLPPRRSDLRYLSSVLGILPLGTVVEAILLVFISCKAHNVGHLQFLKCIPHKFSLPSSILSCEGNSLGVFTIPQAILNCL